MITIRQSRLPILAALASALLGCGPNSHTSTEVENEIKVSSIQGVAATGYAMSNATWEVFSPQGDIIAQGTTDAEGRFSTTIDTIVDSTQLAWLVRVSDSTDTLFAIFTADSSLKASKVLFGLVNPITSFIAHQFIANTQNPTAGYGIPNADSIQHIGTFAVREIFGAGLEWKGFDRDPNYAPALRSPDSGYFPSANDILIHSLSSEATRLGISLDSLLDTLFQDPNFQALEDQGYRFNVATNMVLFSVPPEVAKPQLSYWASAQGIPNDSNVVKHYEALWQYDQENRPSNDSSSSSSSITNTLDASNQAMQIALATYDKPNLDTAMQGFSYGSQVISSLIFPLIQEDSINPDCPCWFKIARSLGLVFASLNPSYWKDDSSSVRALAQNILNTKVLFYADSIKDYLPPDSIKTWVDKNWSTVIPSFSQDPRRTDVNWIYLVPPPPNNNDTSSD